MIQIDIDQEVFDFLQKNAKPFVDTPNTVLRRLLKISPKSFPDEKKEKPAMAVETKSYQMDTNEFVHIVLEKEFQEEFRKKSPYRYMFESANILIYFQNFNQESATLWFRIHEKPYKLLKTTNKESFLCLTNPAERTAYLIPVEKIEKQIGLSNYERDYLEINIDHISRKWKELHWDIKQFLKTY